MTRALTLTGEKNGENMKVDEETKNCPGECAGTCAARECHYLREAEDGRLVAVSCVGRCEGRCLGRLDVGAGCDIRFGTVGAGGPDAGSRITVRSRELHAEPDGGAAYRITCGAGCIVGHRLADGDAASACLGACLGLCSGAACVTEVLAPRVAGRGPSSATP